MVSFRPAVLEDCQVIFDWRNDPEVRENSLSTRPVTWQEHEKWFRARVSDPVTVLYILLADDQKPVGQVRIDINGDEGVISITIAAEVRGRGYGGEGLRAVIERLIRERRVSRLMAFIKEDNISSQKIFFQNLFVCINERLSEGRCFLEFERFFNKELI